MLAEIWSASGAALQPSLHGPVLHVEFCGERVRVPHGAAFRMGSDADLDLDVGDSLPPSLIELRQIGSLWFLQQVAAGADVDVRDGDGYWRAALQPGGVVPLVFERHVVHITARGTYEVDVLVSDPLFDRLVAPPAPASFPIPSVGSPVPGADPRRPDARLAGVALTDEQVLLLAVLAAPVLRRGEAALSEIPSSVEAAGQLGWAVTKFNRKLDTICARLAAAGMGGLHGGSGRPALNRRTRLVQIAVAAGIVQAADLHRIGPA